MPTIADVAEAAGVAISTVSYAVNGTRPISEETRRRIFAVMDELGYKPNALARGLASKRSRIIALLFPATERGLGFTEMEFVTSAANAARENQHSLVLWTPEMHELDKLRHLIQQGLADGVVVMEVHSPDERINLLREINFPFSMIGRCEDTPESSFVDIDFKQTIEEAIHHLTGLGHTHIAFLNQSQSAFDAGYGPVVRTQTYFERTMKELDLHGSTRFCPSTPQAGYDAFNELLAEYPDLTALVTMNERALPGVIQAIADRDWRIPDDFSLVVIVSSAYVAEMTIPPLTTLEPMTTELGRLGVEHLIKQLEFQEQDLPQVLLPCQLVVRGSSGPCR